MPTATLDDITARMEAIVSAAVDRVMTEAEITEYEGLETEATRWNATEAIRRRQEAHARVDPPLHPGSAGRTDEADLEAAFNHYLRTGRGNQDISDLAVSRNSTRLADWKSATQVRGPRAAQSEGVGSEGGYLVPEGFRTKLIERIKAFGGIANIADEIVTDTGNDLPWPTVDDTANEGEIVQEGGTWSLGADITFGTASLSAYRYAAGGGAATPIRVSWELAQDAVFDVEKLVARLLGLRIARVQARHLAAGTGIGQPKGLVDGLTGIEILDDADGITFDDLVNFTHGPDPAYRELGNCRWVMNDTMLGNVQKIKDSHGDPIWSRINLNMGDALEYGYLLGYPVTIDQGLPSMTAADNTINWGAFGDIREGYVVRRVRDVVIVVNPWTRANNGQVEYSAWARMDATQQNTAAYVALTGEA